MNKKKCLECKGSGRIENPKYKNNPDPNLWRNIKCPKCKGFGYKKA